MTLKDQQELLLAAARAPKRTVPEQYLMERTAMTLLTASPAREQEYVTEAVIEGVCPFCLWPAEPCPECELPEPWCPVCDLHLFTSSPLHLALHMNPERGRGLGATGNPAQEVPCGDRP